LNKKARLFDRVLLMGPPKAMRGSGQIPLTLAFIHVLWIRKCLMMAPDESVLRAIGAAIMLQDHPSAGSRVH
jgi:hypothetical protein